MIELRSPGLRVRLRANKKVLYWECNAEARKVDYPIRTQRLWSGPADREPTETERIIINRECHRLRGEMKDWFRGQNFRRKRRPVGFVYFALNESGLVKIGFATIVSTRLSTLQIGSAEKLQLLGTISGNGEVEKFLHWQFRHLRERGEWFRYDAGLQEFVKHNVTPPPAGTPREQKIRTRSNASNEQKNSAIKSDGYTDDSSCSRPIPKYQSH